MKTYRATEQGQRAVRRHWLKWKYGITEEEYDALLAKQEGRCAVCRGIPETRMPVDHDHNTGRVRGLLCQNCNRALGLMGDNVEALRRAVAYLSG